MKLLRQAGRAILGPDHIDECGIIRTLARRSAPVMIDVGAHGGGSLLPFARDGWTVHAFEPDPTNRKALWEAARSLPNVSVSPLAISSRDGVELPLFTSAVSSGISSLAPFHESHKATTMVSTTRLDTYLSQRDITEIGFLKVDAEGHDLTVLESFPWAHTSPAFVMCEFEDRKTVPLGHTHREIADLLISKGYSVLVSEWFPVVEYGQRHVWRRAVKYPCDVPKNAWGNLLALPPDQLGRAMRLLRLAGWRLLIERFAESIAGRSKSS